MDPFIGEIKMVGFNFAPRGYALCNGQLMSIAQNSAMFSLLGTTFGGDGVQTFGLPNYHARTPVGMGQGAGLSTIQQGEMAGTESVTLMPTQLPMHTHQVAVPANTAASDAATPSPTSVLGNVVDSVPRGTAFPFTFVSAGAPNTNLLPFISGPAGGNQPVPIRNPYLGTNFIIATEGVFPSRN